MTEITEKLSDIRLIVLDVDGVMTDGSIVYANPGVEIKSFGSKDGFGITLGRKAGLKFAILTGRVSEAVARRARELKFDFYEAGHFNKKTALESIINDSGLGQNQVMYIGDDVIDLVCKSLVGVFACPSDAHGRVKQEAHILLDAKGGHGAVRSAIDAVLAAKGNLKELEDFYISGQH